MPWFRPTLQTKPLLAWAGTGSGVETLKPDFVLYHVDFLKTPGLNRELGGVRLTHTGGANRKMYIYSAHGSFRSFARSPETR